MFVVLNDLSYIVGMGQGCFSRILWSFILYRNMFFPVNYSKKIYAAASLSMKEKGQTIKGHKGLINNNKMA